jgi:hypothetical protein
MLRNAAILVLLFAHCAPGYLVRKNAMDQAKPLYVADPILLNSLVRAGSEQEQYRRNLFVGEIFFSGPMDTDSQGYVYSRQVRLAKQPEYAQVIVAAVKKEMAETLETRRATKKVSAAVLPLRIQENMVRAKLPEDGRDNTNLPRIEYSLAWSNTAISQSLPAGYYFVPVIENYYGHTGGWFFGQSFGSGAGARFSMQAYVFDSEKGSVVFHFRASRKKQGEYDFKSDSSKMSHELAQLEEALLADWRKELQSL